MELRDFAIRLLHADTLEGKLYRPPGGMAALTDREPGAPVAWDQPSRPVELCIAPRKERKRLPAPASLHEPDMRVRCLHAFANHELMAVELMAWALLAYPQAPAGFRAGLVRLIFDEQRHLKLYMDRIAELGARFGDLPVNDHFWRCADSLTTPLKWVCAMNLTFEQGNLDHAPVFEEHFRAVEDHRSGDIMRQILEDEIFHVGFGVQWLKHYAPTERPFEAYVANLTFHNAPGRARSEVFNVEARRRAGLDEAFIEAMQKS